MEHMITMPKLSANMKKGVLAAWTKQKGDIVKKGDVLYEVEAEKVVSEIESTVDGILTEIYFEEGDEVDVDTPVARICSEH